VPLSKYAMSRGQSAVMARFEVSTLLRCSSPFTAEGSGAVARYDPVADRVDWIGRTQAAGSHMLALSNDAATVYTANVPGGSVSIVPVAASGETTARKTIAAVPLTEGVAFSPDGREVWAGSVQNGGIAIIDVATETVVAKISAGLPAYRLVFAPDGKSVFAPRARRSSRRRCSFPRSRFWRKWSSRGRAVRSGTFCSATPFAVTSR
jgi:YVTN family beta-propeller protein